jgi:hypothetical protein
MRRSIKIILNNLILRTQLQKLMILVMTILPRKNLPVPKSDRFLGARGNIHILMPLIQSRYSRYRGTHTTFN